MTESVRRALFLMMTAARLGRRARAGDGSVRLTDDRCRALARIRLAAALKP